MGVCVCVRVNAVKRGHTNEISQEMKDTQETTEGAQFVGGGWVDKNDVKCYKSMSSIEGIGWSPRFPVNARRGVGVSVCVWGGGWGCVFVCFYGKINQIGLL